MQYRRMGRHAMLSALATLAALGAPAAALADPVAAPRINGPAVVGVRPDTPFLWTVPATGTAPLTFSAQGLPKGLAMSPTGTITGEIAAPGDYAVGIGVRNGTGRIDRIVHIIAGDTAALTPPMGWNSYDAYGSSVSEAQSLANAQYLRRYMQPYGWDTVVVDFRWYDPASATTPDTGVPGEALTMDSYGRLLPAPNRFPSAVGGAGFQPLAERIHAMGLKFGIHIMRGIPRSAVQANLPIEGSFFHAADAADTRSTCPWCPDMYGVQGDTPAGQAYYDSLLRLYAAWGVDYVKMDDTSQPYHAREIEMVRRALDRCGRTIVFSLSPGETPVTQKVHVAAHANLWRVSSDFWDGWDALDHEFAYGAAWQSWAGPGHWPDADMLPVGHISLGGRPVGPDRQTRFTHNEQITLLSLWSLLPSPLMVGANLPDNDPWTLALLTNPEVLAIDQDSLGAAAAPVTQSGETEVWARKLSGGSWAIGLFNRGGAAATVVASWKQIGIRGPYTVRDLWLRKNLGRFDTAYAATVPSHGALLLHLTRAQ